MHPVGNKALEIQYTAVPFQVQHKLNYFQICQFFWILIVSYDKKFKNS
jgi:hypothetical protein